MLSFPNGTPIDAVQARIEKAFARRTITTAYGEKTIQDGFLVDGTGAKIKFKAWEHPELGQLEGKEFVIHASSQGKGLKVVHESYKAKDGTQKNDIVLEVGKMGQFQHVAVYSQTNGLPVPEAPKVAQPPSPSAPGPAKVVIVAAQAKPTTIHGATAGLAANKAVEILIATGYIKESLMKHSLEADIVDIGGQIVKAALRMEAGDLGAVKPVAVAQPGNDQEVPF